MCKPHCIWAGILVVACILSGQVVMAETITLRSGKVLTGQVILQNDEVIILKDATGARFQFPMDDVERVEQTTAEAEENTIQVQPVETVSKVAIRLNIMGGGSMIPDARNDEIGTHRTLTGGNVHAEVQIGSRDLSNKRIFVGGSIGYEGVLVDKVYSLVPLKAVVSIPLMVATHAPEIGMNLGYAFGTGQIQGGITGGIDVSWRYQITEKLVFLLGGYACCTQTRLPIEETINNQTYINHTGRAIVQLGIKTAFQF